VNTYKVTVDGEVLFPAYECQYGKYDPVNELFGNPEGPSTFARLAVVDEGPNWIEVQLLDRPERVRVDFVAPL
jgi:hypothetical protein